MHCYVPRPIDALETVRVVQVAAGHQHSLAIDGTLEVKEIENHKRETERERESVCV